jgi:hypothetical protein
LCFESCAITYDAVFNLSFGDLTVLVGPQATGKSIALQPLKLMLDAGQVQEEMSKYGLDWEHKLPDFLDVYFGEGMKSIYQEGSTSVEWEEKPVDLPQMAKRKRPNKEETLFPYQRSAHWACATDGPVLSRNPSCAPSLTLS